MSPIRLIILGILLYIGYLLIKGGGKNLEDDDTSPGDDKSLDDDASVDASDVLIEDPVCKKLVPKQQAVTAQNGDETVYFCSKECCNTYVSKKGAEQ